MSLTREAFRAYYCAALQSVPSTMSGGTPLATEDCHKKALALVELAQAEEEVRFRSGEDLVGALREEVAELEKLAADRGEENRGRGHDLLAYDAGMERLVRALYPAHRAGELLGADGGLAPLVTCMVGRIQAFRGEVERMRGPLPVDHAAETLAQLECMLTLPVGSCGNGSLSYGERWGRVAGRVACLVELELASQRREDASLDAFMHRRGTVDVPALEAFLKRHEAKASAEAEPVRGALLGFVQQLAALMVRQCAPPGAGLLGGTALVEPVGCSSIDRPLTRAELGDYGSKPWLDGWRPDRDETSEWLEVRESQCIEDARIDEHGDMWRLMVNTLGFRLEHLGKRGDLSIEADAVTIEQAKREAWLMLRFARAWHLEDVALSAKAAREREERPAASEPLNPGEVPECGNTGPVAYAPARYRCSRPLGHEGPHESPVGDSWGG